MKQFLTGDELGETVSSSFYRFGELDCKLAEIASYLVEEHRRQVKGTVSDG